jgi:hypothetical protein
MGHPPHDLRIYKPVGDFALHYLDKLAWDSNADPYNRADLDYEKESLRGDILYGVKHFFEIMVLEALHVDIGWHMWLYYLSHLVEKMCRNSRILDPISKPDEEFPNRYCRLIYEYVTALREFVRAGVEIEGSPNLILQHRAEEHENNNIVKSSIFALSECMGSIVLSDQLGERFQGYMGEIILRLYFELRESKKLAPYAEVLSRKLQTVARYREDKFLYVERLQAILSENRYEFRIKFEHSYYDDLALTLGSEDD